MSKNNPFGEPYEAKPKANPFGDDADIGSVEEAATRMDHAARKIRQLKTQLGAEGLTLTATRDLIDEISAALDASARALRDLDRKER
jgi:flagellin-like hook-associated protein FlgL